MNDVICSTLVLTNKILIIVWSIFVCSAENDDDNKSITNFKQLNEDRKNTRKVQCRWYSLNTLSLNPSELNKTQIAETKLQHLCLHTVHAQLKMNVHTIRMNATRVLGWPYFFHVFSKSLNWFDRQKNIAEKKIRSRFFFVSFAYTLNVIA